VIGKWERPLKWKEALNGFTMLWEDRIQQAVHASKFLSFALKIFHTAGCGPL